ncbi:hypothetical protein D3C75_829820 [compost metagenome]
MLIIGALANSRPATFSCGSISGTKAKAASSASGWRTSLPRAVCPTSAHMPRGRMP